MSTDTPAAAPRMFWIGFPSWEETPELLAQRRQEYLLEEFSQDRDKAFELVPGIWVACCSHGDTIIPPGLRKDPDRLTSWGCRIVVWDERDQLVQVASDDGVATYEIRKVADLIRGRASERSETPRSAPQSAGEPRTASGTGQRSQDEGTGVSGQHSAAETAT